MKTLHPFIAFALLSLSVGAAETAPPMTAVDLAAKLSALQQDGASFVRLRLDVSGAAKLQLQIKQRRTKTNTDIVYQVLWPKERKGESVLLRKAAGQPATGAHFVPPGTGRTLSAAQMKEPLFGSALSYEDVLENFFAWGGQTLAGTENVGRVSCLILESKPGKGERSSYATVRSWVDARRLVPLRVEKYLPSGQLARRIDTTRVATDDMDRHVPATLTVRDAQSGSVTEMEGSSLKHGVIFADREFTAEGFKEMTVPRSAPE